MVKILGQRGLIFYAKHILILDIQWDISIHIWQYFPTLISCCCWFVVFPSKQEIVINVENGILYFFHVIFIRNILLSIYVFCSSFWIENLSRAFQKWSPLPWQEEFYWFSLFLNGEYHWWKLLCTETYV